MNKVIKYTTRFFMLVFVSVFMSGLIIDSGVLETVAKAQVIDHTRLVNPNQVNNFRYNSSYGGASLYTAGVNGGHNGYMVVGTGAFDDSTFTMTFISPSPSIDIIVEHASVCGTKGGEFNGVDAPDNGDAPTTSFFFFNKDSTSIFTPGSRVITRRACSGGPSGTDALGNCYELDCITTVNNLLPLGNGEYGGTVVVGIDDNPNSTSVKSQQNAFNMRTTTGGAKIGFDSRIANIFSGQIGLTNEVTINLANTYLPQYAATDFYLPMVVSCTSSQSLQNGQISFYDADNGLYQGASGTGLPQLNFTLMERPRGTSAWSIKQSNRILGGDRDASPYKITINNLSRDNQYIFSIGGLERRNALQMGFGGLEVSMNDFNNSCYNPIGSVDSCSLTADKKGTILRGWAFDGDANSNDGNPRVDIKLKSGSTETVYTTYANKYNYRNDDVEIWVSGSGTNYVGPRDRFRNPPYDDQYGWEITIPDLYSSNSYSVSGTVFDFGNYGSPDAPLGIGIISGPGFVGAGGNEIPKDCLPTYGYLTCTMDIFNYTAPYNVEFGYTYTPKITLINNTDQSVTLSGDMVRYEITAQDFTTEFKDFTGTVPGKSTLPFNSESFNPQTKNAKNPNGGKPAIYTHKVTIKNSGYATPETCSQPVSVGLFHSVRGYGMDVGAGTYFKDESLFTADSPAAKRYWENSTSGIFGLARMSGELKGSGAQILSFSNRNGGAYGFPSAAVRKKYSGGTITPASTPLYYMLNSLSNKTSTPLDTGDFVGPNSLTGDYSGLNKSIKKYWDYVKPGVVWESTNNITDLNNITGVHYIKPTQPSAQNCSGKAVPDCALTIGMGKNNLIAKNKKITLFVDGDVFINDDIVMSPVPDRNKGVKYDTRDEISAFYLIVRGNIYIAPNVKEISGAFIALPTIQTFADATPTKVTKGVIYTCSNNVYPYNANIIDRMINDNPHKNNSTLGDCGQGKTDPGLGIAAKYLYVKGALAAKQIKFTRTTFTVASASFLAANAYISDYMQPQYEVNPERLNETSVTEEVYYNPAFMLAKPALPDSAIPAADDYDAVTVLPPIY